ncbi:hypothetical protein [Streptomyces kanasensis]|uniref:hypothetical protein n=1 Tax=Streptomyces kanasensis TaxID=936756 RepID=UPI000AD9957C|nr:hypothetical protein [Streptomyces kanasensis]
MNAKPPTPDPSRADEPRRATAPRGGATVPDAVDPTSPPTPAASSTGSGCRPNCSGR